METDQQNNIERTSRRQIGFGSIISYCLIVVSVLLGLFFTPWLSKYLGTSQYGLYTLALSLTGVFSLDYGLSAAAARFIAECRTNNDKAKESLYLSIIARIYLLIDLFLLVVLAILYFFLHVVFEGLTDAELSVFQPVYVTVAVYSVFSLPFLPTSAIFTAYEKFVPLKIFSLLGKLLSVGLMALAIIGKMSLESIVLLNLGSLLLVDVVKVIFINKTCHIHFSLKEWDKGLSKNVFSLTVWIALVVIGQELTQNLIPTILGKTTDSINISIYGYGLTFQTYVSNISNVVAGMFLAKITRIAKDDPYSESLYPLFLKVGKYQLSLLSLMILGFCFFGQFFISKLMGTDFSQSFYCALFLMLPLILQMPKTPMYSHSYFVGTVKFSAIILFCFSLLACGLSFFFSSKYGAVGASATIGIVMFLGYLSLDVFVFWRKQKIQIWRFFVDCYLKFLPSLVVPVIVGILFYFYWPVSGWAIFVSQVLIFCFCFFVSVFFIFYRKKDRQYLLNKMAESIHKNRR